MTRMCIVCGKTFKLDRSAYRHVQLSHYVPDAFYRYYVTKVDVTVNVDVDDGDDVEVEFVS
jgi:hypothetical protein